MQPIKFVRNINLSVISDTESPVISKPKITSILTLGNVMEIFMLELHTITFSLN